MKHLFLIRLNGRPFSRSKYLGIHKAKLDDLRHVHPAIDLEYRTKGNSVIVNAKTSKKDSIKIGNERVNIVWNV